MTVLFALFWIGFGVIIGVTLIAPRRATSAELARARLANDVARTNAKHMRMSQRGGPP